MFIILINFLYKEHRTCTRVKQEIISRFGGGGGSKGYFKSFQGGSEAYFH